MLRFECPRCQTVFTRDRGDDDAFVECPSCGALAMSAGEATGVDSDALARNLSSTHDIAALQARQDATADGDAVASDSTQAPSDEGNVEDSGASPRPGLSDERPGGGGIFNNLLGVGDDDLPAPPPMAPPPTELPSARARGQGGAAGLDLGLDDELGDFDLPVSQRQPAAPARRPAPPKRAAREEAAPPAPPPPPPEVSASLGDDALGALEAAFDTLASAPVRPAASAAGLSDDERRFLENVMGSGPPPPPPRAAKVSKPPPRPPEKPGVPRPAPPPLKKKAASTGFALSPEAREAAFIPLKVKRPPPRVVAEPPPPPPPVREDPEITAPNDVAPPRRQRPAAATEPAAPLVTESPGDDVTAVEARRTRAPRPRPTVWRDLHKGALAAAILVGLLAGAGAGAALAPSPQKRNDARARAELALADGNRYYEAARYDDALGKFKNAINNDRTYAPAHRAKGAALAKQAMMAAQTQQGDQAQKLWDEAAAAYREYLALEPSAIDAADIKDALARRGVAPVTTGTSDG